MKTVEQRLRELSEEIARLADEAWRIADQKEKNGGKATTPYWNIPAYLGDAERACAFALRVEQEEHREAANA